MARIKNINQFHQAIVSVKKETHAMWFELERTEAWYAGKKPYYRFGKRAGNGQSIFLSYAR